MRPSTQTFLGKIKAELDKLQKLTECAQEREEGRDSPDDESIVALSELADVIAAASEHCGGA